MAQSDENTETAADQPSDDGPWGFKKFSAMERDSAIKAAKRRKVTVPDFVAGAIRREVESEREESRDVDLFPPGTALVVQDKVPSGLTPLSVAEIGQTIEIAEQIARLRDRPVSRRLLKAADRALFVRLNAGGQ